MRTPFEIKVVRLKNEVRIRMPWKGRAFFFTPENARRLASQLTTAADASYTPRHRKDRPCPATTEAAPPSVPAPTSKK